MLQHGGENRAQNNALHQLPTCGSCVESQHLSIFFEWGRCGCHIFLQNQIIVSTHLGNAPMNQLQNCPNRWWSHVQLVLVRASSWRNSSQNARVPLQCTYSGRSSIIYSSKNVPIVLKLSIYQSPYNPETSQTLTSTTCGNQVQFHALNQATTPEKRYTAVPGTMGSMNMRKPITKTKPHMAKVFSSDASRK